jgi:diacylglycerol kinase family enzyme
LLVVAVSDSIPTRLWRVCVTGDPVAVDVGRANNRWFINAASIGFGAVVTVNTPSELKRLLGGAAYTLMAQSWQRTSVPMKDASFCRIGRSPVRMFAMAVRPAVASR